MSAQQTVFSDAAVALPRGQLLSALLIIASFNGLAPRVISDVAVNGWYYSIVNTFDTSVIVWGAWAAACYLSIQQDDRRPTSRLDIIVCCITFALVLVPFSTLSWFGLALLSAYVFCTSRKNSPQRRSAVIFFAICVPMLWGPMLFTFAAQPLLRLDAFLVSSVLGTERIGNVVGAVDGIHRMQIWPPCSSFHNISQAGLAWIALSQTLGRSLSLRDAFWCALAVALAAGVNLARLSLLGIFPEYFDTIHGPIGAQIAGGLTLLVITIVCMFGFRRELFART